MSVSTLLSYLKNDSNLSLLVGTRIYRSRIPQNPSYPLIMFSTQRDNENSLDGLDGVVHYTVTFEVYGKDYEKLEDVVAKLKTAISNAPSFKGICVAEADDEYFDENKNYSIFLDYSIWF